LFLPAFALVMAVACIPIGYAFYQSVHASRFLNIGAFAGIDNFVRFFARHDALWNSVIFTIGSVGVAVPLGIAVAIALSRIERGRGAFRTLLIVPWLISNVVVAQLWGWLMNPELGPIGYAVYQLGLRMPNPVNSDLWAMPLLILVHAWAAFPLVMVMSYAALQTIPKDTLEAATIDGATTRQQIFLVMLPLIATPSWSPFFSRRSIA
jgi:multiple sugar transport system permease protein